MLVRWKLRRYGYGYGNFLDWKVNLVLLESDHGIGKPPFLGDCLSGFSGIRYLMLLFPDYHVLYWTNPEGVLGHNEKAC